jgi:excisionase family DNA binding protein
VPRTAKQPDREPPRVIRAASHLLVHLDLEPVVAALVERLAPLLARPVSGQPAEPKRAYRVPEAATLLSLSESEVRLLVSNNDLASIRVGRVVLVPASSLDAFIADRLAGSPYKSAAPADDRR